MVLVLVGWKYGGEEANPRYLLMRVVLPVWSQNAMDRERERGKFFFFIYIPTEASPRTTSLRSGAERSMEVRDFFRIVVV